MAKIYLIRHAESIANTFGIYQGQTYDTDLSELGKKQAKRLGEKFQSVHVNKIFASPLKRTKQTAQAIAKITGAPIEFDMNLIETNHGEWEGLSKDEIKVNFSTIYENWQNNPSDVYFPSGESFSETVARAEAFLTSNIFEEDVAVIAHDNIIRAMLCLIENTEINNMWGYGLDPAGVTVIKVNYVSRDNFYKVVKLNDTDHLKNLRADINIHAL